MSGKFDTWNDRDIRDVIDSYPMASIIPEGDALSTIEMPVLLDCDGDGRPTSLTGHLPRHAPIANLLTGNPRCMFLFRGPEGYISPSITGKTDWAPTWNFVVARVVADIVPDDAITDEALDRTVAHMERGRTTPWTRESLGARYQTLRAAVIGFRAPIRSVSARFKLGQDEQHETFAHIVESLEDEALVYWMRRMNGITR
ncbi:FMN-binding negative transcriptional regulator [Shinella sp.]|uniref:FMN-binding negative transcriptional regulator n=1 Tax=Shinella sp. TaxID=1870904 RepID=UPI003F6FCB39